MILALSKSEKNPGRLYLKCPRRTYKLFQWINESPKGLALACCIKKLNKQVMSFKNKSRLLLFTFHTLN